MNRPKYEKTQRLRRHQDPEKWVYVPWSNTLEPIISVESFQSGPQDALISCPGAIQGKHLDRATSRPVPFGSLGYFIISTPNYIILGCPHCECFWWKGMADNEFHRIHAQRIIDKAHAEGKEITPYIMIDEHAKYILHRGGYIL